MAIRVRFAPSPTGFLHIGGLRTALYNFLFARKNGGTFILRIEDTDQTRLVEGAVESLLKTLAWAGLEPDEGPHVENSQFPISNSQISERGSHGPYVQSKRLDIYKKYAAQLLEQGSAYECFCSSERLLELRQQQTAARKAPRYDGLCLRLTDERRAELRQTITPVLRLKIPGEGSTTFDDLIHGSIQVENAEIDHQVLMKSDGFPTYHLANVVDDHLMEISHVIRGEEWLPSTPKHILLYKAFGWASPEFAHVPLLLNPDKSKLSKRQGDVAVEDYIQKGYLREALINFVALLGWNPKGDQELYTIDELISLFDIAKVNKGGAMLNLEKLEWMNGSYIRKLPLATLTDLCLPFLSESAHVLPREQQEAIVALEQERLKTIPEISEKIGYLFTDALVYEPELLLWKKMTREEVITRLTHLESVLAGIDGGVWTAKNIEEKIRAYIAAHTLGLGETLWPMRAALSAQKASPGPFAIAAILGKERTLARIAQARTLLSIA
ncbi:glutamate--tRNA ligase [Candidatus Uhrbacteria bacterium]|nr:glutamate--tRNA ligase [Candidatus Uhrbacteria bacterium]